MSGRAFLFCSAVALHPPFLRVGEIIARRHRLIGHVIAPDFLSVPVVHRPSGRYAAADFDPKSSSLLFHFVPARNQDVGRYGFEPAPLRRLLREIHPDYIWIHAEFWQGITHQFLRHYRFRRGQRIVAYVAINHMRKATPLVSAKWSFFSRTRLKQMFLWPRLDGVAACSTGSMKCARSIGLPRKVPIVVNYLPVFGPDDVPGEGIGLPWPRQTSFTVGFAGTLSEQKGWKVLLTAIERLPERFKIVIAGDGAQREELTAWLQRPGLKSRACYPGVLSSDRLLATFRLLDAFVLPSITTPESVEQFGRVLAEAMAAGVPVIASDSGAIPETVGAAGLIVPEGDPDTLAQAILRMSGDKELRDQAISKGMEKFHSQYSCEAYARSIVTLLQIIS